MIKRGASPLGAALALLVLLSVASGQTAAEWEPAAQGVESLKAPLITMLVAALVIGFAFAWYRVVTGQKQNDDD